MEHMLPSAADAWIDAHADDMLSDIATLVDIGPNWDAPASRLIRAQEFVRSRLESLGFQVAAHQPDPADIERDVSFVNVRSFADGLNEYRPGRAPALVGTLPRADRAELMLGGHVDVEPASPHSTYHGCGSADKMLDGALFGRGAVDMLSGLVASMYAACASWSTTNDGPSLAFHSVIDEELGGNGTVGLLQTVSAPSYVVIAEPTYGIPTSGTLGFTHFAVSISGESAHGTQVKHERTAFGRLATTNDAIAWLSEKVSAAIRLSPGFQAYDSTPIVLGVVRGGEDPAVPPSAIEIHGAAYLPPHMSPSQFLGCAQRALNPIGMEVRLPNDLTFPGSIGNATSTLAQASVRAAQVDRADGFPSPCDARLFAERGSDVVVWGPGDLHKAHSDNESIDVKDLQNYCKMLARLCADPKLERIPYAQ